MMESDQLGWRVPSVALDGQPAGSGHSPIDDPQLAPLLLRLYAATDVRSFLSVFRSMLNEVVSNGCPAEQIALLARLHPNIEMTLQRLSAHEDRAVEDRTRRELTELALHPSLHEPFRRLTRAERQLVELLCQGASNKEIAAELDKSIRTVKSQLTSVYKKFGVKSRSRLLALMR